ncbi:MAG: hypothetical protein WC346_16565 [Methanogenium sp.]
MFFNDDRDIRYKSKESSQPVAMTRTGPRSKQQNENERDKPEYIRDPYSNPELTNHKRITDPSATPPGLAEKPTHNIYRHTY